MATSEYLKRWRETKLRLKLCQICGVTQVTHPSKTKCIKCRDKANLVRRAKYNLHINQHKCVRCGSSKLSTLTKCKLCSQNDKIYKKRNHIKLKYQIVQHYGGKCACCGESWLEFLTVDHINNNGAGHRGALSNWESTGIGFYKWIKRSNFPVDLQILCWTCNCGKNFNNGICPHQSRHPLVLEVTI